MTRHSPQFGAVLESLKLAVAALRDRDVQFMLGGSVAAWARGGPEPQNDLDLMVKPAEAEAALNALTETGMKPKHPPEEWLFKAWHGDTLIDVIFRPSGMELTDEVFARADTISVTAIATPVMALEDVLVTMLCAIDEHSLDYSRLVAIARALREQIAWPRLRSRTAHSPYAAAFFTLAEGLQIAPVAQQTATPAAKLAGRVRVLRTG